MKRSLGVRNSQVKCKMRKGDGVWCDVDVPVCSIPKPVDRRRRQGRGVENWNAE